MEKRAVVEVTRFAEKQLNRIPRHIYNKFMVWSDTIEINGLDVMRRYPGFNDEALKGNRSGLRSSRLSKAYRVIYEEHDSATLVVIAVLEVNKHDY